MSHRTGRYPDWMLKAMLKAGMHRPTRQPLDSSESDLTVARIMMLRATARAEANAARAKIAGMIIAAKGH